VGEAIGNSNFTLMEEHAEFLYLVFSGYRTGGGERLQTSEVDIFVGSRFLMTVHEGPLPTLGWLQERIEAGDELESVTPMTLLAQMALASSRRYVPLTRELENQIDGLEELAMVGDPRTLTEVHALRRDVILLHRVLGPQRLVSEDVIDSNHPVIDEQARHLFARVSDHQARVLETLEAARAMLGSVLETHRGAVADQTNEIVRVLTVFSAVMLPLGLIAGIWGMNFERIPAAAQEWGFWGILGLMLLIAVSLWVYFARRGFVGAPRVRELPKAVGLGLIQVGTTPIKVLAGGIESTIRYVARGGQEESGDG
jgi:magnesium transporter